MLYISNVYKVVIQQYFNLKNEKKKQPSQPTKHTKQNLKSFYVLARDVFSNFFQECFVVSSVHVFLPFDQIYS